MKIELTEAELISMMGNLKQELFIEYEKVIDATINDHHRSKEFATDLKNNLKKTVVKHELFIF